MNDKIIFLRSQLPKTDSRLQRYLHAIVVFNKESIVVGWDRSGHAAPEYNEVLYQKKARIGGGWRNLASLICWNWFLARKLWLLRGKYSVIHAVDLDTITPAILFAKLFRKRVIFDIYDKYTDSRQFPKILRFIADSIERFCAAHVDNLILADECRCKQLQLSPTENIVILENIPASTSIIRNHRDGTSKRILAYVGILEPVHRGLEDLLQVVSERSDVLLLIAGDGGLRSIVEEYANNHNNIHYFGAVDQHGAIEILSGCDIQIGLYYKTIRNHFFAAPNKYYEHLMMGKPLLTTSGTPPGLKVEELNTGYSINEGKESLRNWLNDINDEQILSKGANASGLWERKYSDYFQTTFIVIYKKCLYGSP